MTRHDKNTRHETKLGRNQNSNSFSFRVHVKYKNTISYRVVFMFTNTHEIDTIEHVFVVFFVFIVLYMIKYELNKIIVI